MNKRNKILVVDKKSNYLFLFQGFRKNKFAVEGLLDSILKFSDNDLASYDLFFVVLYDTKDIFELLKVLSGPTPVVVASANTSILKKIKEFENLPLLDLSLKSNIAIRLHECIKDVFV